VKKIIFLILTMLFIFSSAYSVDWGGFLESTTAGRFSDRSFVFHGDKIALWLSTNPDKKAVFDIQGSYTYSLDRPYLFNLDLMRISWDFPDDENKYLIDLTIGRYPFSDFTSNVFSHDADGISLGFHNHALNFSTSVCYTGLLTSPLSNIKMSKGDSSDIDDDNTRVGPQRLIALMEFNFPELFLKQDFDISLIAQQDFRAFLKGDTVIKEGEIFDQGDTLGGDLNTYYIGIGVSGNLVSTLYWDFFSYFGAGRTLTYNYDDFEYQYEPVLSYLGGIELTYFLKKAASSVIGCKFLIASGDSDNSTSNGGNLEGNTEGVSSTFVAISNPVLAMVFNPDLGNIFLIDINYSIMPNDKIQTKLNVIPFFRTLNAPISEYGIDPDSDSHYLGTEIDYLLNFRPLSDIGFSFSGGIFIPNRKNGAFKEDERKVEGLIKLDCSFSF